MPHSFPDLQFLDDDGPAPESELAQLEHRLQFPLPDSLRAWLTLHNGGLLDYANYFIPMEHKPSLPCSISVEYLLSVAEIHHELDKFEHAFPPDHLPFAHDGDGNYLLIARDGTICFWDYYARIDPSSENALDDCTVRIAESLTAFLAELGPGPLTEPS